MKKLKVTLFLLAVAAGGANAVYQFLLTDEAKESIANGCESLTRGYAEIKDALQEHYGVVAEDDQPLFNVEQTKREWEALGL